MAPASGSRTDAPQRVDRGGRLGVQLGRAAWLRARGRDKALEELDLKPDLIVGAPAGALLGSLCASGLSASEIETLALELQPFALARLSVGATERLSGSAIADLVHQHSREPLLERMPVPMACVAAPRPVPSVTARATCARKR